MMKVMCVGMRVFTGFGVILAIASSSSFAPTADCLGSTTMTLVWPMMIVLLPFAPPRPPNAAHTFGFTWIIERGSCAATGMAASAPNHATTAPIEPTCFELAIGDVLQMREDTPSRHVFGD